MIQTHIYYSFIGNKKKHKATVFLMLFIICENTSLLVNIYVTNKQI